MSSKFPVLPVILGVGAIGAIFLAGSSTAKADDSKKREDGSPPVDPKTNLPKTAVIDDSTNTPGKFAEKYGGSWGRWREIASANPGMIVVDKPYTIEATGQVVYTSGPPANITLPFQGIIPWKMGQVVTIPSSWT